MTGGIFFGFTILFLIGTVVVTLLYLINEIKEEDFYIAIGSVGGLFLISSIVACIYWAGDKLTKLELFYLIGFLLFLSVFTFTFLFRYLEDKKLEDETVFISVCAISGVLTLLFLILLTVSVRRGGGEDYNKIIDYINEEGDLDFLSLLKVYPEINYLYLLYRANEYIKILKENQGDRYEPTDNFIDVFYTQGQLFFERFNINQENPAEQINTITQKYKTLIEENEILSGLLKEKNETNLRDYIKSLIKGKSIDYVQYVIDQTEETINKDKFLNDIIKYMLDFEKKPLLGLVEKKKDSGGYNGVEEIILTEEGQKELLNSSDFENKKMIDVVLDLLKYDTRTRPFEAYFGPAAGEFFKIFLSSSI